MIIIQNPLIPKSCSLRTAMEKDGTMVRSQYIKYSIISFREINANEYIAAPIMVLIRKNIQYSFLVSLPSMSAKCLKALI